MNCNLADEEDLYTANATLSYISENKTFTHKFFY